MVGPFLRIALTVTFDTRARDPFLFGVCRGRSPRTFQLEKVVSGLLSGPLYERKEIGGIPVIVNRSLERAPENFATFDAFVSDAEKLRQERVIVLDLRSNVGGSSEFVDRWVYSLTREHPSYAVLAAPLMTNTAAKLRLNSLRRFGDEAVEALKEMYEGWEQEAAEAGRTSCPGWGGAGFTPVRM